MMKNTISKLVFAISFGFFATVTTNVALAASSSSGELNLSIEGGPLVLEITNGTGFELSGDIDVESGATLSGTDSVAYRVIDNRGSEDAYTVQQTLSNFAAINDNEVVLKNIESIGIYNETNRTNQVEELGEKYSPETTTKLYTVSPIITGTNENAIFNWTTYFNELKLEAFSFNKAGNYTGTLTTEIVTSPSP